MTIVGAPISIECANRPIAVFDKVGGILNGACAHVDTQHRLGIQFSAEMQELIRAKLIGFDGVPSEVTTAWALVFRPDAIFPVIPTEEIAAGIANRTQVEVAQCSKHIPAQSVFIGMGRCRIVDASINAPSHMLRKPAEEQWRNGADNTVRIKVNGSLCHNQGTFIIKEFCR